MPKKKASKKKSVPKKALRKPSKKGPAQRSSISSKKTKRGVRSAASDPSRKSQAVIQIAKKNKGAVLIPAKAILEGKFSAKDTVKIGIAHGRLTFGK